MSVFTPDPSYSGLLKQAKALSSLVSSQEKIISYLRGELEGLNLTVSLLGNDEVEEQRKANHELTNLLQEKDETIEDLREQLRVLDEYIKDLQCEKEIAKAKY